MKKLKGLVFGGLIIAIFSVLMLIKQPTVSATNCVQALALMASGVFLVTPELGNIIKKPKHVHDELCTLHHDSDMTFATGTELDLKVGCATTEIKNRLVLVKEDGSWYGYFGSDQDVEIRIIDPDATELEDLVVRQTIFSFTGDEDIKKNPPLTEKTFQGFNSTNPIQ